MLTQRQFVMAGGGDDEAIRGFGVEVAGQGVGVKRGPNGQLQHLKKGAPKETSHPLIGGTAQMNPPLCRQQGRFPCRHDRQVGLPLAVEFGQSLGTLSRQAAQITLAIPKRKVGIDGTAHFFLSGFCSVSLRPS